MTSGWQNTLARVSRMDWDETRTRVAQELHKRGDLTRHWLGMGPEAVRLKASSTGGKFFFARGEAAGRAELLRLHLPIEAASIVREADDICEHRFRLLGYENLDYGAGKDIDWHLDGVNGKRAPLAPWFKIPFLEFDAVGDHKVTWELNRHQHLVTLAKAWLLTSDEEYLRELTAQWRSWVKANPYPLGINWGSTLEVAFRSLSWTWVDRLLEDAPGYAEFRAELLSALAFHGRYIERYLSTYFSPNTHLLGEALTMFALGVLYPQMPHAEHWKTAGWAVVGREASRQVRPDGVYFEQSLYYHVYALDFFLYARLLATTNGVPIPAEYDQALSKMLSVVAALAQAGPAEGFGDDDGGRVFNPRRNQTEHMTDPLALGALAYCRGDLAAARLTEESIWLFGEGAISELAPAEAHRALNSAANSAAKAKASSVAFPDAGLYVLADSEPCPQTTMIDAGPQGTGRCGHGHADALSLRLTMNGSRWLVDSGSGVYVSSDPADRNAFRGTAAHNTLLVDGLDQAVPGEPFSWAEIPAPQAESWVAGQTFIYFSGSHNGYARLADAVTHRRSVLRVKGGGDHGIWLVRDVAIGQAEHDLELHWHFASDVIVTEAGAGELVASKATTTNPADANQPEDRQPALRLLSPEGTAWKTTVTQGLLSPAYGRYQPAPVVRSEARVKLPAEIATVFLVDPHGAQARDPARMFNRTSDLARAYELVVGGQSHSFLFARDTQPWSSGPWSSDAQVLYCRMENERLTQLIVIGGSALDWQGRPLLKSREPFGFFEWRRHDGTLHADPATFSTTSLFEEVTTEPISSASSSTPSPRASNTTSTYAEKH